MLNGPIRKEQLAPYRPDFRSLSMLEHRLQPLTANNLRVIIQKEDIVTVGMGDCQVVYCGVIERSLKPNHVMRYRTKVVQRLGVGAAIIHNDYPVIAVGGQTIDTL